MTMAEFAEPMEFRHDNARLQAQHYVLAGLIFLLNFVSVFSSAEDATWLYAVQISATIQANPPQITLSWPPDQYGANSYVVYRKLKDNNYWGSGTSLPGWATTFTDSQVAEGRLTNTRSSNMQRMATSDTVTFTPG